MALNVVALLVFCDCTLFHVTFSVKMGEWQPSFVHFAVFSGTRSAADLECHSFSLSPVFSMPVLSKRILGDRLSSGMLFAYRPGVTSCSVSCRSKHCGSTVSEILSLERTTKTHWLEDVPSISFLPLCTLFEWKPLIQYPKIKLAYFERLKSPHWIFSNNPMKCCYGSWK